ncbi:MBL fold metallo-hydrolase [Dasania sp. GY-MA-18]|uniref:MBL fold metallo-hydrolase n=1 Tax=Dasania phycosphaerae TaxID=2950436 RepID=A0A9J6RM21_9GAMM|nr:MULTISPECIES: MBL fold metallo-hydrolase [Dasania]MCR8923334.1 MBL fold metallo-hydrolase [Dasania sp. GY-MA-18]MCZ0865766.1 MBL fold metallo-hydrolase [Dasania phycosphaerae]MCZ0869491.1 MBL fold metallo-hydrolase [Dasania phycosphaerae]
MATVTFYGAIEGVTGSAYLLATDEAKILLDCGLFQGRREEEEGNLEAFPFDVTELDAVVLSHAHLDHSGRLPKLVADGYNAAIYMTSPSVELLEILLNDAVSLQLRDVEWENKRLQRAGKKLIEPMYTLDNVKETLTLCSGEDYGHRVTVAKGIDVCFRDAGHILGSAIVEVFVTEQGVEKKLVFSGDLGNSCSALLRDPEVVEHADVLLLESTYGDRNHRPMDETLAEFEDIVEQASKNGGNILIPSFAVGRTQEIIFRLGELYQKGKLRQQAVYLDSPMAIAVTEIYHRYQDVYNTEDQAAMKKGAASSLHSFLPVLRYSSSTAESIALNNIEAGAIIIAGSGMCNGGRIRHHFKHNLWRRNAHVIFVGFQAMGTPGRALVDGAKFFNQAGEKISVKAAIHTIGGFSAHASQSQLLDWINGFSQANKPRLFLVHGEEDTKVIFKSYLKQQGWDASIPAKGETITF